MKRKVFSHEFHARLTAGGAVLLPPGARSGIRPGELLRVQIGAAAPGTPHGRTGPDEAEVLQIAAIQSESPDVIRKSLAAQGVLAGSRNFGARKIRTGGTGS
jgi:hypothetical protein